MALTRHRVRAFLAAACAVVSVLGWGLVGPGRLAAAALLENEHCIEASLADGHLDLRLGHPESSAEAHRHEASTRPDHVIHLCAPSEWLPPKAMDDRAPSPAPVVLAAEVVAGGPSAPRAPFARAARAPDRSPPRSTPLLI